jgi:predicted Zn-dependent peptidase
MAVTFQKAELGNGLTVIGEIDQAAHTASAGFFVKTGARDEAGELMGVSHFLEHMMFKGTPSRSADEVNLAFDEMGADYNAYTSSEITCFYASTLPERHAEAVALLADILRPALREEDFDTERNVILEEIAMYRDHPFWNLYEAAAERHYGAHPLGHRVLGTEETVSGMSAAQMRAYFNDRYSADNTVLALAGAVDFDRAVKDAERLCGAWERTGAARDTARPSIAGDSFTLTDDRLNRAYMLMLAEGPPVQSDDRYAAMMLAKVLGDPDSSRLHWALIEEGLAEEAQAAYDPSDGVGMYFVYASGEPGRADEIWSVVERELAGLVDSLDASDLERLRNKLATQVTLAGERPSGRMQRIGRLWTYLGEHASLEDELERINSVTLDDLRRVHAAYPFEPRTAGRLLPA